MKRYIYLVLMVLVSVVTYAQGFNPNNPPEPTPAYRVTLVANPPEAATLSGGGSYATGASVSVKATATGKEWEFVNWTSDDGSVVSTKASFTYKVKTNNVTLTANFRSVPLSTVTLTANPESLFKSSSTVYKVGQTITVSCNTYSYYTFQNWTDATGAVLSTSRSFSYTVPEGNPVLTANFKYTPESPKEPTETKAKHRVYFRANPSADGYFGSTSGMQVSEGSSYSVTAAPYTGYSFVNWTDEAGNVLGTTAKYQSTMGTEDVNLVANFSFSPGNPSEPGQSTTAHYTLYLPTVQMYQGESTMLPVYLENTGNVRELSFTINLPENVTAETDGLATTSRTSAYTPTAWQSGTTLNVSVTGGSQVAEHNGVMLYIPLTTATGCDDGEYPVTFASATAVLADGSQKTLSTRNGVLQIVTLEEGDLQAQFGVDRYLNRVQLTNMSSATAKTYLWDFGDGTTSTETSPMHIYANPGTYTVRLTAKAIVKTSTAEQIIVVNDPSTWTASGDYTLDRDAIGIRNFTSIDEMVDIISQCKIDGDISVNYQDNRLSYNITDDETLSRISSIATGLRTGNYTMTIKSEDTVRSINLNVKADGEYYSTVMGWLENIPTIDVNIYINNVGINTSALRTEMQQTVYSGETTEVVTLTALTTGADVTWTAAIGTTSPISGYMPGGSGDIPPMILELNGKTAASLTYDIVYSLDDHSLYTTQYTYNVLPQIQYVDANDLAALTALYNALSGNEWTKKWNVGSNVISADNWYGVTFDDEGYVTQISLSNNRLTGTVPTGISGLSRLKTLNLSKNTISGNLAAFVSGLTALQSLNMSYCMFDALDDALPSGITDLNLGYQLSGRALSTFELQQWEMSDQINNVALSTLISYNHASCDWSAHPRLKVLSSGGTVAYLDYNADNDAYAITLNGSYTISSGTEFEVQVANGPTEGCRLRAALSWQRGDANANGGVDVTDAQQTLNYILGRYKGNFNYAAANTYADETINIQDIVTTVNIFIDDVPSAARVRGTANQVTEAWIYTSDDAIILASDQELGAIDVTIDGVSASQVETVLNRNIYHTIIKETANGIRVVIISPVGSALPSAHNPLLTVYGNCTVLRATAADIDADAVSVGVSAPDGIQSIHTDKGADDHYDLLGRPVNPHQKGILITKGKKIYR